MTSRSLGDGIRANSDELGTFALLEVDTSIYSQVAILRTAYWFTENFFLFLSPGPSEGTVYIELRSKGNPNDISLEKSLWEFCNSLLDHQVRQDVIQETGGIRDVIIRKAFSEGHKHADPNNLDSDESNIPTEEHDFKNDQLDVGHLTGQS